MSKEIATVRMDETRKIVRSRKRWKDEDEEDLNIRKIKKGRRWSETVGNRGRLYWEPR